MENFMMFALASLVSLFARSRSSLLFRGLTALLRCSVSLRPLFSRRSVLLRSLFSRRFGSLQLWCFRLLVCAAAWPSLSDDGFLGHPLAFCFSRPGKSYGDCSSCRPT